MSSFTKKAIMESFLRLAGKKSLDKITVRDIVDECGINRNTFYYHFQDIYAVMEALCKELFLSLPEGSPLAEELCGFLRAVGNFSITYPRSTHGLVLSLGYDGFYRYFAPELQHLVLCGLEKELPDRSNTYLRHLTAFICHAVVGLSVDVLKAGGKLSLDEVLGDLQQVLEALISDQK